MLQHSIGEHDPLSSDLHRILLCFYSIQKYKTCCCYFYEFNHMNGFGDPEIEMIKK